MTESILMNSLFRRDWIFNSPIQSVGFAFEDYLRERKYGESTTRCYLAALAHFAYWMKCRRLKLSQVDRELCEQFVASHVSCCRCPSPRQRKIQNLRAALVHLRAVLSEQGLVQDDVKSPILQELDQFQHFLSSTAGLAQNTCISRAQIIREFLVRFFPTGEVDLSALTVRETDEFVLGFAKRWKPASLLVVRSSLKSYMRYRALEGDRVDALSFPLPVIANWGLAKVPKTLSQEQVRSFLAGFKMSNPVGLRDYAIARCLIDLGLRGHEVAALRLDCIDWRSGTVAVHGSKGRRVKQLPLPWDTGAAIARYLRSARPKSESRILFVRHTAPLGQPLGVEGVRSSMKRAFARCGLQKEFCNTHVFRHNHEFRIITSKI